MFIDIDEDNFSPPEDCDDENPLINPDRDEVCDGIDNDCDDLLDEGTLNRCGECGPEPAEICDGIDNDCDGRSDEATLNRCGRCGAEPEEICDMNDNDCDGRIDENTLNACGTCGQVPNEVCDGNDNDCDGRIDENTLNACGTCGQVPNEVCDGNDNDCDGRTDETLPINACGQCGPLPTETCDGVDNDCDRQVDEELTSVCFSLKETIIAEDDVIEMGSLIKIVGDLDGDGNEDAIIRVEKNDLIRLQAYSSLGNALWSVEGEGELGTTITSGYFFNDTDLYIAINDPDNDRIILYNSLGQPYVFVNTDEGEVTSMTTLGSGSRDTLVYGIPEGANRGRGLIKRLRFDPNNPIESAVVYSIRGNPDEFIGEHLYNVGNLLGNNVDDLLITVNFNTFSGGDRGTKLMDGSNGYILDQSLYRASQNSFYTFAEDLALGQFDPLNTSSFAYGAPGISTRFNEQGAIFFLHGGVTGYIPGVPIYGQYEFEGLGISLETLPRQTASADTLIIGGYGELTYRDFSNANGSFDVPLPINNLFIGIGLAVTKTPSADGTYQVWVSGLSDEEGESRVWILSAR